MPWKSTRNLNADYCIQNPKRCIEGAENKVKRDIYREKRNDRERN
jgi:hypothetical protein